MVGAALCWPICGLQRARVNLSILFGAWGTSPDALVVIMPVLPIALGPYCFLTYVYGTTGDDGGRGDRDNGGINDRPREEKFSTSKLSPFLSGATGVTRKKIILDTKLH